MGQPGPGRNRHAPLELLVSRRIRIRSRRIQHFIDATKKETAEKASSPEYVPTRFPIFCSLGWEMHFVFACLWLSRRVLAPQQTPPTLPNRLALIRGPYNTTFTIRTLEIG